MTWHRPLSRRTVLKGLGTSLALPFLESWLPAEASPPRKPPLRMVFVYAPNGKHMADWTPRAEGRFGTLPPTLEPLRPFQDDLLVLSGLAQRNACAGGDGPGPFVHVLAARRSGLAARGHRRRGGVRELRSQGGGV